MTSAAAAVQGGTPSPKLLAIRALTAAGYTLIPLYKGKNPGFDAWEHTMPGEFSEAELARQNYGIALRSTDLVVDIDPRNFAAGDSPVRRLVEKVGKLSSFTVKTGGGGYHIYFKKPADMAVRNGLREYPGVEFKAGPGRQMVGPGSLHPESGKEYVVEAGSIDKIADAPSTLLALIFRTPVAFDEVKGTGAYVSDAATQGRFLTYLEHTAEPSVQGKGGDANAFKVACHGRDLGLPPALTWELMLEVWNKRCTPPWDAEELRAKVIHAYKYAAGAVGSAHPAAAFEKLPENKTATPAKVELSWDTTAQGALKKTFNNLINYFRDPKLGLYKLFAYNEFTGREEYVNPAPWHMGRMPASRMITDRDFSLIKGYLSARHGYEVEAKAIEQAITNIAHGQSFHPVREYLEGLKWDGKSRLDFWLRDYLGVAETEYSRACARKVLCAAVMRVFSPGIKFDHVLVLEGTQDIGKSSVIEILGHPWSTDAAVDPHNRDTIDMMQGRWIIEMAEMEAARRTDEEALKAFITRKTDMARLAYGRRTGEFPRQSIFIATKNPRADGSYLKDETGGRRWWPVRCEPQHGLGQVDFKGLKAARDQLFAEAVVLMKKSPAEKLYMETSDLKLAAREEAAARFVQHEWVERIAAWVDACDAEPATRREFLTSRDVYIEAMGGSDRTLDQRCTRAIAGVLRGLGWRSDVKWINDRPVRGFSRGPAKVKSISAPLQEMLAAL